MVIDIVAVGRLKTGPESELCARYLRRAIRTGPAAGFSGFAVQEVSESRARTAAARKSDEAAALGKALRHSDEIVVLDENGPAVTTQRFAADLRRAADSGKRRLSFVIGGADGLAPELLRRADRTVAFGAFTWPHQIVRILLAEQLYRAMTIFTKHPYHRS